MSARLLRGLVGGALAAALLVILFYRARAARARIADRDVQFALANGDVARVRRDLANGADPRQILAQRDVADAPLVQRNDAMVHILRGLGAKLSLNAQLIRAAEDGSVVVCRQLIAQGASPAAAISIPGQIDTTALAAAMVSGEWGTAETLADAGARPNDDAIRFALKNSAPKPLLRKLLRVDPSSADVSLELAAMRGRTAEVRELVALGANLNVHTVYHDTPLCLAEIGRHPKTVAAIEQLLRRGTRAAGAPLMGRKDRNQFLVAAALAGDLPRVEQMVQMGVDVNFTVDGESALVASLQIRDTPLMLWLLNHGAKPTVVPPPPEAAPGALHAKAQSPMEVAMEQALPLAAVKALIAHGASPNQRQHSADGMTLLMVAAAQGSANNARTLLDAGADPNMLDARGWSALAWAKTYNHPQVTALLEARIRGASKSAAAITTTSP
ncbi:MAG: ankyrin repeat domain-containing protein [Armatimonadetes bacterium]|nr:ankyrin repeat domain-containing protein [Armatimonadota bacterium]MDE2207749.1 ankyrin repeat domain-containing protein [Armatimonadota bacterium]